MKSFAEPEINLQMFCLNYECISREMYWAIIIRKTSRFDLLHTVFLSKACAQQQDKQLQLN